jgi:hypothetical protein
MKESVLQEESESNEEFRKQRKRKRNPSDDKAIKAKKTSIGVLNQKLQLQIEPLMQNPPPRTKVELQNSKGEDSGKATDEEKQQADR